MVDGEVSPVERALLDAHLSHCETCRGYLTLSRRTRQLGVAAAPEMPDLSRRVVHAARVSDRRSAWSAVRFLLGTCGVSILLMSVPELVTPGHADGAHEARHLGAFTVAYAVALLVVVVRPVRARAMLPVAMVLTLTLVITAAADLWGGHLPLLGEATHLPELASVVLLWLMASPTGHQHRPTAEPLPSSPRLSLLERLDDTA